MIAFIRRLLSRASEEKALREIRERIAQADDVIASTLDYRERLLVQERRLTSRMLMNMQPDDILRRAGAL